MLRALTALLTAVSVLTLTAVAGLSYLWCPAMGEARLHCCCPEDDATGHETVRRDCCEHRVMAELPAGADSGTPRATVPPAVLDLTWLASFDAPRVPTRRPIASQRFGRARAGPPPRVHARCSVYLV